MFGMLVRFMCSNASTTPKIYVLIVCVQFCKYIEIIHNTHNIYILYIIRTIRKYIEPLQIMSIPKCFHCSDFGSN